MRKRADADCHSVLKPIFLGDLIHLSASVNRAWSTSMEIGVKVMKSDERSAKSEYVSHCQSFSSADTAEIATLTVSL